MKVIFPIQLNAWQSFLYYHGSATIIAFFVVLIISLISLPIFSGDKASSRVPSGFNIGIIVAILISIAGIFVVGSSGQTGLPNKTKDTVYDTYAVTHNSDLHWTAVALPMENKPMYLKISGDNKIVKCIWTSHTQKLTPLNNAGKAYLTVANKIYKIPRPKSDIKMYVTLAYTKGRVITEDGVKKFICYSNNKRTQKIGYKVLKY